MDAWLNTASDSTVWEDAGIEPRTVTTLVLAVRRSSHSARSQPKIKYGNSKVVHKEEKVTHESSPINQCSGSVSFWDPLSEKQIRILPS